MTTRLLIVAGLLLAAGPALAEVPPIGATRCLNCLPEPSTPSWRNDPTPIPSGPSPEELARQKRAADKAQALDQAHRAMQAGRYRTAIDKLSIALNNADDPAERADILRELEAAQAAEAARVRRANEAQDTARRRIGDAITRMAPDFDGTHAGAPPPPAGTNPAEFGKPDQRPDEPQFYGTNRVPEPEHLFPKTDPAAPDRAYDGGATMSKAVYEILYKLLDSSDGNPVLAARKLRDHLLAEDPKLPAGQECLSYLEGMSRAYSGDRSQVPPPAPVTTPRQVLNARAIAAWTAERNETLLRAVKATRTGTPDEVEAYLAKDYERTGSQSALNALRYLSGGMTSQRAQLKRQGKAGP